MALRIDNHTFKASIVVTDDGSGGRITSLASYQRNLYLGTSKGTLRHYHLFEDAPEYILISERPVGKSSVSKILILSSIERALVICGGIAVVYSLPELSHCNIGKLKDVNNAVVAQKLSNHINVIIFNKTKIRLISIFQDSLKLVTDINYSSGSVGAYISSSSSTLCLVANAKNYDIVDLEQQRKISLFEYNFNEQDTITPHIVPLQDKKNQEFMISIKSDDSTSIAMFVNKRGDAVRGTLTWINQGFPDSLVIDWPFAIGIFEKNNRHNNLVISNLENLEVVFDGTIENLGESENKLVFKATNEDHAVDSEENKQGIDDVEGKETSNTNGSSENLSDLIQKESQFNENSDKTEPEAPIYKISTVEKLSIKNPLLQSLMAIVDNSGTQMGISSNLMEVSSSTVLNNDNKIWLLHSESSIEYVYENFAKFLTNEEGTIDHLFEKLDDDTLNGFSTSIALIIAIRLQDKNKSMEFLLKRDENDLLIDPKLSIFILTQEYIEGAQIFSGIFQLIENLQENYKKWAKVELFYDYIDKIYKQNNSLENETIAFIRIQLYKGKYLSSNECIKFMNEIDATNIVSKDQESSNTTIRKLLEDRNNFLALINVFKLLMVSLKSTAKSAIGEEICRIILELSDGKLKDSDFVPGSNVVNTIIDQLPNLYSDKVYAKYLLEAIKLDTKKSLTYMKSNVNPRFKETHKQIMKRLTEKTPEISKLKMDFLELSLKESPSDTDLVSDLLMELIDWLKNLKSDVNLKNFEALENTYKIENTISSAEWPQISWVDYLRINGEKNECKEFAITYLKIFELLLHDVNNSIKSKVKELEINSFDLALAPSIEKYLEICDYSTAEYLAVHGYLPLPAKNFYTNNRSIPKPFTTATIQQNLRKIFTLYQNDISAVRHFINSFEEFFTPLEVVELLPDDLPVKHFETYISRILIDYDIKHKEAYTTKTFRRAHLKCTKNLIQNANNDH